MNNNLDGKFYDKILRFLAYADDMIKSIMIKCYQNGYTQL